MKMTENMERFMLSESKLSSVAASEPLILAAVAILWKTTTEMAVRAAALRNRVVQ